MTVLEDLCTLYDVTVVSIVAAVNHLFPFFFRN